MDPKPNRERQNTSGPNLKTCVSPHTLSAVLTEDYGAISVLNLANCGLATLPNLGKLSLKQLNLSGNNLVEVPSFLYSGLKGLERLDLSGNSLKTFDVEPACRCTIQSLNLRDNKLYNIPHWILTLRCPKLIELFYSRNFLTSLKCPNPIQLRVLEMCNTQAKDSHFPFFKSIKTLEHLDLSNDKSGNSDNYLKNLDNLFNSSKWYNLRILNCSNLLISVLPVPLFNLKALTELHLRNCDLSWIPADIESLVELKLLDISHNTVASVAAQLFTLPNLKIFKAPYNNISSLRDFSSELEILDLYHNQLEDPPGDLGLFKSIDLEQNYLDMSLHPGYEEYKAKRNKLRKGEECRMDGPLIVSCMEENYESDYSSICSASEVFTVDAEFEEECWDEEIKTEQVQNEKNPEVTSSDDEWDGSIEVLTEAKKVQVEYEENEDWMFDDAD